MASDGKTETVSLRLDEEPREASEVSFGVHSSEDEIMTIYSLFFFSR